MAQNCLLTKLKGTVNDNTLPLIGVLKLVTSPTTGYVYISGSGVTVERYGAGGELISQTTGGFDGTPNTDGYLKVKDKYGLINMVVNNLVAATISLEDLKYCSSLENLTALNVVGDISNLAAASNMRVFQIVNTNSPATGDISVIQNWPNLVSFFLHQGSKITGDVSVFAGHAMTTVTIYAAGIYGEISSFGASTTLGEMYINGSAISGTLESLADAQIAAGRTSGSLLVQCNGHLTLNGSVVPAGTPKTITFSEGSYSIA